jgi:hypothetical protein
MEGCELVSTESVMKMAGAYSERIDDEELKMHQTQCLSIKVPIIASPHVAIDSWLYAPNFSRLRIPLYR